MRRKKDKTAPPPPSASTLNAEAVDLASREAIARLACSGPGVAMLREAQAALQPEQPKDANKLNELISYLEAAVNALSAGAAWDARSGGFLLVKIDGETIVSWWECGEVLSQCVARSDGLSALAVLHAKLPKAVTPDVMQYPHAGILPTPLAGAAVRVQVSDRFSDDRLPELPGPDMAADGDGWLPGFDPGPGPLAKLPVLDFLHAGGLDALKRGRGAPWALRIAYETLIDVPAVARNGGIARLEYPMRGDGEATLEAMLYPSGRLNLSRDWPQFLAALKVVDCFAVPADGGKSAWLPIRVRSYPVRDGGVLRLDVSLPPGSDKGPRILRRVLRRLGARSYPQWRAWLALAYLWDRSAVNGHWVRATRPRLARNSGGRLVDRTGTVILDRRGAPVTKWKDKRAVLLDAEGRTVPVAGEAARERNPEARLHPWLTAADIVALGYPPERGLSASALRMRKQRVLKDLLELEAEGLIVLEAHPDGRRWRVLPPDTDPA